jgi:hypothetical protein
MYMPLIKLYLSGHQKYHCIHTQIVIAADLRIRHVESRFMGHNNNAETFRMMTPIVVERYKQLPLGYSIYPSRHPIVTPFTTPTRKYQKILEENKQKDQTISSC